LGWSFGVALLGGGTIEGRSRQPVQILTSAPLPLGSQMTYVLRASTQHSTGRMQNAGRRKQDEGHGTQDARGENMRLG